MASSSHFYVAYGPESFIRVFNQRLTPHKPLSSRTVRVPSAWLSFDVVGVAYLEPALCSALVRGLNDLEGRELAKESGAAVFEESDVYKKWIWSRTCPQMEYLGELPPVLEGVVYEFSEDAWKHILATAPPSTDLVPVSVVPFANGDPAKPLPELMAHLPVSQSPRAPNLQPSPTYLRLSIIGSMLSVLSREYIAHLQLVRPFDHTVKSNMRRIVQLALLPAFLVIHLPLRILSRLVGIDFQLGTLRRTIVRLVAMVSRGIVSASCGILGSPYRNEEAEESKSLFQKRKRS
ncbi:hypothetical protein T439DRAFT_314030 [Meredithblackwellia eburnea MCA 4105]